MKKVLLLVALVTLSTGAVNAQDDNGDSKNLDTIVVSKVVRWSANAGPGEVAASYVGSTNSYGAPPASSVTGRVRLPRP